MRSSRSVDGGGVGRKKETVSKLAESLTDPQIPTLSEVLDPVALAKHLRGVSLGSGIGGAIEEIQFRVLRHVAARRCTIEIVLRTASGWHWLIGKVFRKDRVRVFEFMAEMQQAGFGSQEEFSIPQPLAYLPSLHFLLQERVEGPTAKEIFRAGDPKSRAAAAERSAIWLARFHALAPRTGPATPPRDFLSTRKIRQCSSHIAKFDKSLARKADRLQQLLEDSALSLKSPELCAGHGAYRPDHVILSEGRTVGFDLDTHDVADPARDLARFLVALRRLALERGSIRALDEPCEIFLRTYLAVSRPGVEGNLRFFEAAAYLKRAKNALSRHNGLGGESAEVMLDEGLRVLEQAVAL